MNPKVPKEVNVRDIVTTITQILAVVGGVAAIIAPALLTTYPTAYAILMALGALSGGAKGSLVESSVKGLGKAVYKVKPSAGAGMLLVFALCLGVSAPGCSVDHQFLKADTIEAVAKVAAPYLGNCKTLEIYPGYRLDWSTVDPKGDPQFVNGFGGILGGCGKYAKEVCVVNAACTDPVLQKCSTVICQAVELLITSPLSVSPPPSVPAPK